MPPLDESNHVGGVEDHLFVNGIRRAAGSVEVADAYIGEVIRLGELESQLLRPSLAERGRHKEIQLIGKAQASFIDEVRAESPHIGNLRVVAAHVGALAIDGTEAFAVAVPRV